jgi:hypothetical protein
MQGNAIVAHHYAVILDFRAKMSRIRFLLDMPRTSESGSDQNKHCQKSGLGLSF